jgi:AcrR family transcriptional regulator
VTASQLHAPPLRAQQERTREVRRRILDAAVKVLVEKGYAQATTLLIQERAGVSRGRLLHHFPSRDALLLAAAHHLATERMHETFERTDWPSEPSARIDAAIDLMGTTYGQPYFWAATELWIAARSHADLRKELFPAEQQLGALIRTSTDSFFGPKLAAHRIYPLVRDMLHTSLRGIALTTSFDVRPQTIAAHTEKLKILTRQLLL